MEKEQKTPYHHCDDDDAATANTSDMNMETGGKLVAWLLQV